MRLIASIALVLCFATVVFAGEGYKCDASAQTCINKIVEKSSQRGWIGVELDHQGEYMTIKAVVPGSPAAKAYLKQGDEILTINGVSTAKDNKKALEKTFASLKPGEHVKMVLANSGEKRKAKVALGEIPQDVLANWLGKHMLAHAQVENIN